MPALVYGGAFPIPNGRGDDFVPNRRVKRDADGQCQYATNANTDIDKEAGLTTAAAYGSVDEVVTVEPLVPGKVYRVETSEANAAFAVMYRSTNGRIKDTSDGAQWGIALEASGGAGEEILVQYLPKHAT